MREGASEAIRESSSRAAPDVLIGNLRCNLEMSVRGMRVLRRRGAIWPMFSLLLYSMGNADGKCLPALKNLT